MNFNEILNQILQLDKDVFLFFNTACNFAFFDWLMPIITREKPWFPFILAVWLWLFFSADKKWRPLAITLLICVSLTDFCSSFLIKNAVGRKRPCCTILETRKLIPCAKSNSFPSSHAANCMAFSGTVLFETGIKIGAPLILLALLIGFSRIYVGVHYPLDVGTGIFLGLLICFLVFKAKQRIIKSGKIPKDQK